MWPIPDNLSFAEAASLPLNYLTALHALQGRARLAAGETLLVMARCMALRISGVP